MKIADLKQPYRRMAEYCKVNIDADDVAEAFTWAITNHDFWGAIDNGEHPPITEEIKKHFPPGFDFSEEEVKNKPVMQMLDTETQKYIYTQLAKEGKFDELPDTCEFSMPVTLEVFDEETKMLGEKWILGKFRGRYISTGFNVYLGVKLPTPKIDFSQFKTGDVVEVETSDHSFVIGYFSEEKELNIDISYAKDKRVGLYPILKEFIKSITKLK